MKKTYEKARKWKGKWQAKMNLQHIQKKKELIEEVFVIK